MKFDLGIEKFNESALLPKAIPTMMTYYEELVVQNLCREPHSSVTVRRFCKQKTCCHVRNCYPSDWHRCPNPHCNVRFLSKKKKITPCISFPVPAYGAYTPNYSIPRICSSSAIEPGCGGWKPSTITTTLCSLQQCKDKMSYLNQMYKKKAMARA